MGKRTKNGGTCRLCRRETDALQESHVLSDFLYRELYDDKHRVAALSQDRKPTPLQTGVHEPMLCCACEQQLSRWESYAARKLRDLPPTRSRHYGKIIKIDGIDYDKFKLFQLSLIWRMGVSQQPTFNGVVLGRFEEELRRMLHRGDPGNPLDYPVLLISPSGPGAFDKWICISQNRKRIFGHVVYQAFMSTLYWIFFVSRHTREIKWRDSFLSCNGVLPLHVYEGPFEEFVARQRRMIERQCIQL